jgi:hypothetical protein
LTLTVIDCVCEETVWGVRRTVLEVVLPPGIVMVKETFRLLLPEPGTLPPLRPPGEERPPPPPQAVSRNASANTAVTERRSVFMAGRLDARPLDYLQENVT